MVVLVTFGFKQYIFIGYLKINFNMFHKRIMHFPDFNYSEFICFPQYIFILTNYGLNKLSFFKWVKQTKSYLPDNLVCISQVPASSPGFGLYKHNEFKAYAQGSLKKNYSMSMAQTWVSLPSAPGHFVSGLGYEMKSLSRAKIIPFSKWSPILFLT